MKDAKRQIQEMHKTIKEAHRELISLGLSGHIVKPDHDAMQLRRLVRLNKALKDSTFFRRWYMHQHSKVSPAELACLAANIRATDECIIEALMDFNGDLRRGEKCVSLRPDRAAAGPSGAKAARGRSIGQEAKSEEAKSEEQRGKGKEGRGKSAERGNG